MQILTKLKKNIINIPGWKTNRKIIVFESDDWGSIRMRNQKTFENLLNAGISVDKSRYDSLDSLETRQDLEFLLETLDKHQNKNGDTPKFTTNMVMGNPNFEKIKTDNFQHYHKRSFLDSYQYYNQEDLKPLWFQGIDQKLIQVQFHAREHFNVQLWMGDLRKGNHDTQLAFEHHFFGLKTKTSSPYQANYLAAYRAESELELKAVNTILEEGLKEFEQIFGFKSQSFIACNYVWPKEIEKTLFSKGINLIQSQRGQVMPQPNRDGKPKIKYHYTGQKNKLNQVYTVRNVLFEPFENENLDWVNQAMNDINNSFLWGKPAIISTHRINYVSQMSIKHRDKNLKMLNQLLQQILIRWPEVEFMTSDELYKIIK
jgi:hypothetical protein